MIRTTIDIDDAVLEDLSRLQRLEGKSLGRLVSDLLAFVGRLRAFAPQRGTGLHLAEQEHAGECGPGRQTGGVGRAGRSPAGSMTLHRQRLDH